MIKQENIMIRSSILTAMLIAATSVQELEAGDVTRTTFNYNIFAESDDVGDMQVHIIKDPQGGYQILESATLLKNSDWDEINLRYSANEMYSLENNLMSADKKTFDQTKSYWSKLDSSGTDLWMNFSEIKDFSQKEESDLVGFSIAFLDDFIPEVTQVIGLS